MTPEALASAGLSSEQTAQLVALLALDSDAGVDQFRAARVARAEAREELEALASEVRAGRAQPTGMADLRTSSDACESACAAAESALLDLASSVMTGAQASALATIRANVANGVALPYAATELTPEERVHLRDGLTAREEAERTGLPLEPSVSAFLSSLESLPEVTTAQFGLDGLAFVRSSFYAALGDLDN